MRNTSGKHPLDTASARAVEIERQRRRWRESKRRQRSNPTVAVRERAYDQTPAGRERKRRYDRSDQGRLRRYRWRRANSKSEVQQFGSIVLAFEMREIDAHLRGDQAEVEKCRAAAVRAAEAKLW
jgi:hypothetical protein